MITGILQVIGSFLTHDVPVVGTFLGGAADTVAAIVQVVSHSIFG